MLSTMLADGISVFASPGNTARRRLDAGLSQLLFSRTLIVTAFVSVIGLLLPEINGVSAAMDHIAGPSPDAFDMLTPSGLVMLGLIIGVPTALIIWRGPAIAARLSALVGGSADVFAGAVWIYLATAASLVVTLAVMASDVIGGFIGLASPSVAGGLAWITALAGTLAVLSSSAALARAVLSVPGPVRALVLIAIWLVLLLAVGLAVGLPFHSWVSQ